MEPRRIILADMPRFLREMLKRAFEQAPGLCVAGEVADLSHLSSAIERIGAQWIVVSLPPDGKMPAVVEPLLAAHPTVRVLAVTNDGSQIKMQWVEPHEQTLESLSLDELIAVLLADNPGQVKVRVDLESAESEPADHVSSTDHCGN